MKPILYLDAGHGGLHPQTGRYLTAPAKLFKHKKGDFHQGSLFFEGVSNRIIAGKLELAVEDLVQVVRLYHDWKDTGLMERVNTANRHWYAGKKPAAVGISFHSNAAGKPGSGSGWEVFTSPGRTKSDRYADILWEEVKKIYPGPMREERADGDHDKEAKLTMCTRTDMPFVLSENLFFDNFEEANLLIDPEFQNILIGAYRESIKRWFSL